jgi:hypothetical protein
MDEANFSSDARNVEMVPFRNSMQSPVRSVIAAAAAASSPPPIFTESLTEAISINQEALKQQEYEAKQGISYSAKDIDFCIRASLGRYGLKHQSQSRFIIESQSEILNNTLVVMTPVIEVGTHFSCVADYFNGISSNHLPKSLTDSPMSSSALLHRSADLWNEILPYIVNGKALDIKILFAFTANSLSWVVGEIIICKRDNRYQLHFYVYDPLGQAALQPEDYRELKSIVCDKIKRSNNEALIDDATVPPVKRMVMLAPDDQVSSCVMTIEILLSRASGKDVNQLMEYAPIHYRNCQLQSVLKTYEQGHPKREAFITNYAKTAAQSERANQLQLRDEFKLINYTSEEKYMPLFSDDQKRYFLQIAKLPEFMRRNEKAAFYAAMTNNVLLLQALFGIQSEDEIKEQLQQLTKESYNASQERREIDHKIGVTKLQIKLIEEHLRLPESDQDLALLKATIDKLVKQLIEDSLTAYLDDHIGNRDEAYINLRLIKPDKLTEEQSAAIRKSFYEKLSDFKTKLQTDFESFKYELPAILEELKTSLIALERSYEVFHASTSAKNMKTCELENELRASDQTHKSSAAKFWALKKSTWPDFMPMDEYGYWSHVYGAHVPIHIRDHNYNTLLHVAYSHGHIPIVLVLLARGASIEAKNNDGLTPYQLVHENKDKLLALSKRAQTLVGKDSEFLSRLVTLKYEYQQHLAWEADWYNNTNVVLRMLGQFFFEGNLIDQRKQTLRILGQLIELAAAEYNDTKLIEWIKRILEKHHRDSTLYVYKDRGVLNRSKLYAGLDALVKEADLRKEDYGFIRLVGNASQYLLECGTSDVKDELARTKQENAELKRQLEDVRRDQPTNRLSGHAEDEQQRQIRLLSEEVERGKSELEAEKKRYEAERQAERVEFEKQMAELRRLKALVLESPQSQASLPTGHNPHILFANSSIAESKEKNSPHPVPNSAARTQKSGPTI